jgi:hypothetical protein
MTPRRFKTIAPLVILLGLAAGPVWGQAPPSVRVVNRAQILSRPSADATVVSSADVGTILSVLDGDGQWYWIALPADGPESGARGWVRAADVQALNATDVNAMGRPPAPSSSIFIPPTAEELRAAQAQREMEQRQRQIEEERIERARLELERRRLEYEAVTQSGPAPGRSAPPPVSPSRRPLQSDSRIVDIFGGYAWLWDSSSSPSYPLGWTASVSGRVKHIPWTVVGEISGSYTSVDAYGVSVSSGSIHTFTAGPRFSGPRAGRLTLFGQVLGGLAVERSTTLGNGLSATGFALTPGFGVDLPVARSLGVRIGGELGFVRDPLGWSNQFRLETGLVVTRSRQ